VNHDEKICARKGAAARGRRTPEISLLPHERAARGRGASAQK
jgi:hypothetical protein